MTNQSTPPQGGRRSPWGDPDEYGPATAKDRHGADIVLATVYRLAIGATAKELAA